MSTEVVSGTPTHVHDEQRRAFQAHAAVFAAGLVIMFAVNLVTNLAVGVADQWSAWWAVWALVGWGFGITVHGFVVLLNRPARDAPRPGPHQSPGTSSTR